MHQREGAIKSTMADVFESSKVSDEFQTTVPSRVHLRLNLERGDRIRYLSGPDGRIYIESDRRSDDELALEPFLDLLQEDIDTHPENLVPIDDTLYGRIKGLVEGVEVDLDQPLQPDSDD